jgi:SAM-dependent methyltransferase
MTDRYPDFLRNVADYYSAKLAEHGETPRGVDWNGADSQRLRFEQLIKIIDQPRDFCLNDLGCGYGALYEYLCSHYNDFTYHGLDISGDMIRAAAARYSNCPKATFTMAAEPSEFAHYCVASGIFNVRLEHNDLDWFEHVGKTLDILHRTSSKGFAFNCLTSYSDIEKMRNDLYYADPCVLFDVCKRRYSSHVALLHDYGLYEFTILVRKYG